MDIRRKAQHLELSEVDPFLAELLRQVPESTAPGASDQAARRLYSDPANDPEVCEEWKLYVQPELRRLFQSATEVVSRDLGQLNGSGKSLRNCKLKIPIEHADQWLNTLNQARLVIAEKYQFTDKELCDHYR